MDSKGARYGAVIVAGGAIALWAGVPPFFLLFLVACPLMMFVMMRGGMHGGTHADPDTSQDARRGTAPRGPTGRGDDHDHDHR